MSANHQRRRPTRRSADGQLNDAAVNAIGGAQAATTQFGAQLAGFFGGLVGNWTGGPTAPANAAAVNAAAAAAAAAQAAQAQYNASVSAQLPHFYGGSGTSGLNAAVAISGSVPGTFTTISPIAFTTGVSATVNCALYNTPAQTNQQTVSGIWTSALALGESRLLVLRAKADGTTLLYALLTHTQTPALGGILVDSLAWEFGCFVAGVQHSLHSDSVNISPSITANNLISFEVTDYTLTLTIPGLTIPSFTDSVPVSQLGPLYLSGGFGDTSPLPVHLHPGPST
jgi:hypothetical protein